MTDLKALPSGYWQALYHSARWGVTVVRSADGRRIKLYGEALGGADHVSFNLYLTDHAPRLKPCEMPAEKVIAFVSAVIPLTAT